MFVEDQFDLAKDFTYFFESLFSDIDETYIGLFLQNDELYLGFQCYDILHVLSSRLSIVNYIFDDFRIIDQWDMDFLAVLKFLGITSMPQKNEFHAFYLSFTTILGNEVGNANFLFTVFQCMQYNGISDVISFNLEDFEGSLNYPMV